MKRLAIACASLILMTACGNIENSDSVKKDNLPRFTEEEYFISDASGIYVDGNLVENLKVCFDGGSDSSIDIHTSCMRFFKEKYYYFPDSQIVPEIWFESVDKKGIKTFNLSFYNFLSYEILAIQFDGEKSYVGNNEDVTAASFKSECRRGDTEIDDLDFEADITLKDGKAVKVIYNGLVVPDGME